MAAELEVQRRKKPVLIFGFAARVVAVEQRGCNDRRGRADIDIVKASGLQRRSTANVVLVVGVAAVYDDVATLQQGTSDSRIGSTAAAGSIIQTGRGAVRP
jgi:hypothetical protein